MRRGVSPPRPRHLQPAREERWHLVVATLLANLVAALTLTLQEIALRAGTTDAVYKSDVAITEDQRREFALELVRRYGDHQSFDSFAVSALIQDHVNEGAIDW